MKKEKLKSFIIGVITTTLLFSMTITGFANSGTTTLSATYNNIKIYVNQKLITPKDSNGNIVEPFTYNGTTYVPIRAVSEALGQQVSWDNKTKSVYIGQQPTQKTKIIEGYKGFVSVPDFGKMFDVPVSISMDNGYSYDVKVVTPEMIRQYSEVLSSKGFYYIGSFPGDNGEILAYRNDSLKLSVSCGLMGNYYTIVLGND